MLLDGLEYGFIHVGDTDAERVGTAAVVTMTSADVFGIASALFATGFHDESAAARAAGGQPCTQIDDGVLWWASRQPTTQTERLAFGPHAPGVDTSPQVVVDDAEVLDLDPKPLLLGTVSGCPLAPVVLFACAIPDDDAAIRLPGEHAAHGGWGPSRDGLQAVRSCIVLRLRCAFERQEFGNPLEAQSRVVQVEDSPHHSGLDGVDDALHMGAERTAMGVDSIEHVLVSIAKDAASNDPPRFVQTSVRLVYALARCLAMRLVGEALDVRHDLVDGVAWREGLPWTY